MGETGAVHADEDVGLGVHELDLLLEGHGLQLHARERGSPSADFLEGLDDLVLVADLAIELSAHVVLSQDQGYPRLIGYVVLQHPA